MVSHILLCSMVLFSGSLYAQQTITFELNDDKGAVTHESYPGKYLLMSVGFSSCPDVCPTTLYEYGVAMRSIKNPDAIQPLFVTIDPINDEVGRLNAYTNYFDPRIIGLSGSKENIKALANQLGATYGYQLNGQAVEDPELGTDYTVFHSAYIYLIGPDRDIVDVFDYQIGAEALSEALDAVLGGQI